MFRAVCSLLLLLVGCNNDDGGRDAAVGRCASYDSERAVFFGDLHVHTALSFDSYAFDIRATPEEAYRFAMGEPVALPPLDADGVGTQRLQLERPLDFVALTEHAEFLGEVDICLDEGAEGSDADVCENFRSNGPLGQTQLGAVLVSETPGRDPAVCGSDAARCDDAARSVWDRIVAAAEEFNDTTPACQLATLIGYEWTANTNGSARHRNVIFRSASVPFPTSYFDETTPQGLWRALQRDCVEADAECDVLAIPHNTNQSNGNALALEYAGNPDEQAELAALRGRMERLIEIVQHKGESECSPGLSGVLGDIDELCGFEKLRPGPFDECGSEPGSGGVAGVGCVSSLDFARGALWSGLVEEERLGVNPMRLGFVGSTDTHNGTPGAVGEFAFLGHRGSVDDETMERIGASTFRAGPLFNPGGLAAVWAEENSRESLFDAMARRETYATSGTRIVLRFFAGADFPADLCGEADMVARGYAEGVAMGGVIGGLDRAPSFLVSALRDPGTTNYPGTPLQRVQIVKGWVDAQGRSHQRIFDVAGNAGGEASVDDNCRPQGDGFDSLCTVWRDPEFDPAVSAFYYARVLENPSCRWTALQCLAAAESDQLAACSDPETVRIIQERAWASPIWYDPTRKAG